MLKNKSGFVGIGAYAGNQLLPFYKDGYPCLFANTATTDLDTITSKQLYNLITSGKMDVTLCH